MKKFTFRITEGLESHLEKLVESGDFPSKLDAVRAAIRQHKEQTNHYYPKVETKSND